MVNSETIKSEKSLRTLIKRNLNKEIHPGTKPSMDFIRKILEDAYGSGLKYDVTDMRPAILAFASNSTHHAEYCIGLMSTMHFKSDEPSEYVESADEVVIFYDIEVFPNLLIICWKASGEGMPVVKMINPTSQEVEDLMKHRLVGFNCRKYDNHILYGRLLGYDNEQLYKLSTKIINEGAGFFGEAYNISYTDVYDFCSKKQSLKKWEIELGIHHQELGLPWDKPVPEEMWEKVAEYCCNDVTATEAVFNNRQADFTAREILADIAGGSVNDTTNSLTTRFIFGKERHPQLVYTDLAAGENSLGQKSEYNAFQGYEFKDGKNMYRGTDLGKGGYIISNPGIYTDVALLDVSSLHPHSIVAMNCFGEYTQRFKDILDARVAIKHKEFDKARKMLDGKLEKYLTDESAAKDLAQALKIAINSVYGLTAANFDNPFRDIRNKNNIVALRGALFMRTLQDEVETRGFKIVAIKTDSIKIANATQEIIDFCMEFAKKYGYSFEHEATYDRICQINDADYIARYKDTLEWTVTGAQFAVPYVFKKLFTHENITFADLCETKSVVKGELYLDMNESLPDVAALEKELGKARDQFKEGKLSDTSYDAMKADLEPRIAEGHNYIFVGRVGAFCPIKDGRGGGLLYRKAEGKYYAAAGTKGYRWLEAELVKSLGREADINEEYYISMAQNAIEEISKYGDFERFVSDEPYVQSNPLPDFMNIPEDAEEEIPF